MRSALPLPRGVAVSRTLRSWVLRRVSLPCIRTLPLPTRAGGYTPPGVEQAVAGPELRPGHRHRCLSEVSRRSARSGPLAQDRRRGERQTSNKQQPHRESDTSSRLCLGGGDGVSRQSHPMTPSLPRTSDSPLGGQDPPLRNPTVMCPFPIPPCEARNSVVSSILFTTALFCESVSGWWPHAFSFAAWLPVSHKVVA
eukprot:1164412-Prorocentrum_minimum.AAC.1